MSDHRTFAEKAKNLVQTVREKITGNKTTSECQESESNKSSIELSGNSEGLNNKIQNGKQQDYIP